LKKKEGMNNRLLEGFTIRSILGILYVILILLPTNIYYSLTMGGSLAFAAPIISLIFFLEIFKFSEHPLTKQEAFIIYSIASEAVAGGVAFALIGNVYFRTSPMASYFGISKMIPDWWAPNPSSNAIKLRTFFHSDWILPMIVLFTAWTLGKIIDFSLATYLYYQFIEVEKLPFPLARVSAETVLSLSDPKYAYKKKNFALSSMIGLIYGVIAYLIPILSRYRLIIIPTPFYDFTEYIENIMPGSSIGISTDLVSYTVAFYMPHNFILVLFLTSLGIYLFGNSLLIKNGEFTLYMHGMKLGEIFTWSYISYWISPTIGFGIAIAIFQIIYNAKYIVNALKKFRYMGGSRTLRTKLAAYLFFISTISASLMAWALSGFNPYYILIIISVSVIWSFLFSHLQGRAVAEYGFGFDIPYFVPAIIYISGARDPKLWFAQTAGFTVYSGGVGLLQQLKIATLCETKPTSYIKAWFFTWFIGAIASIIFLQIFWSIAPIPSSMYPASLINFPVQAAEQYLILSAVTRVGGSKTISLNANNILYGFILGLFLSFILSMLKISPSLIGLGILAGIRTWISTSIAFAFSIIIARIIRRKMGKKWWEDNRFVITAGIYAGLGLAIGLSVIILFLQKAIFPKY